MPCLSCICSAARRVLVVVKRGAVKLRFAALRGHANIGNTAYSELKSLERTLSSLRLLATVALSVHAETASVER